MSVSVNMQKKICIQSHLGKMASVSYIAVEVLDFLDANSSDSGSSG